MFSTLDLASAKHVLFQNRSRPLHSHKKVKSFRTVAMTSKDRGEILEVMIADYFNVTVSSHNVATRKTMILTRIVGGRHIRIEVKSAMKGKKTNKYIFQGIKPENFDMLFLVFVDPDNGPQVKTVSKRDVDEFTTTILDSKQGYKMSFKDVNEGPVLTSRHGLHHVQ